MEQLTAKLEDLKDEAIKHLDALWRTATWFGENSFDVATLVIDVYDEAFRLLSEESFDVSKIRMFRLLRNLLFEDIQANSHECLIDSSGNIYELFSSYELSNIGAIPREVIIGFIRNLPKEIRLAMVLSLFEKFTYGEIADVIGVHKMTVRVIIFKGYALIRRSFLEYLVQAAQEPADDADRSQFTELRELLSLGPQKQSDQFPESTTIVRAKMEQLDDEIRSTMRLGGTHAKQT